MGTTTLPKYRALIQEQYLANQNRSVMSNVTRHIFTLRADMARLRRFIDSYLNFVDDDMPPPFYFQPALPFVTFELIYYPYLTVASRNLISYPQREMSFTIPLECYAIEDGVLVFKQYATCVPFLYVDEELSVVSGRELFGLPKVAVKFETLIDQVRPDMPTQIGRLTLRTPGPYGDDYSPFIEVYRQASRFISYRKSPQNLINALPDALQGYYTLMAETWEALARPPISGYENRRDLQSMFGMLRANAEILSSRFPVFPFGRVAPGYAESSADEQLGPNFADIISLKQARDAEQTEFVCFQALVRSTMYIDRINDGGPLFGPSVNDPSGDVTIRIHHQPGQPLIEALGLAVEETLSSDASGRSREAGGLKDDTSDPIPLVSTLKPILPFWMNVDLTYGLGSNLYWRGKCTDWSSTDNPAPPKTRNRYITIGSGALQEKATHIVSPKSRIWALQLLIDDAVEGWERVNKLCAKNLKNDCYVFQLSKDPTPHVWMFIRNMDNSGEGRGPEIEQEVAFGVLVDWYRNKRGRASGPCLGQLLMPLFALSDNQTAVFTESEVFGCPVVRADIDFEGSNWTSDNLAASMNVSTLIIPELYSGDSAEARDIITVEVAPSTKRNDQPSPPPLVLGVPTVNLKQIMNCRLPDRVDFQAVVSRVLLANGYKCQCPAEEDCGCYTPDENPCPAGGKCKCPPPDKCEFPEEADKDLWLVKIYRYASLPLVKELSLKVDYREAGEHTTIEVIQPNRVFSIPATIEELGGVNLAWREGNSPWMSHKDPVAELRKVFPKVKLTGLEHLFVDFREHINLRRKLSDVKSSMKVPREFDEPVRTLASQRLNQRVEFLKEQLKNSSKRLKKHYC